MSANLTRPVDRAFRFFRLAPIRVGTYTGVWLSAALVGWILLANRVPFLDPLAEQRNIAFSVLLLIIAGIPVLRFLRAPADLLISGLLAWGLLTFTYRILTFIFGLLEKYYSVVQVFVLGAVAYLVFATLSWIGIIVWRARAAQGTHTSR